VNKSDDIERMHLKCCKRILNVRSNTCTSGDLGRYPLFITRYVRIIKYWFKLLTTGNIILRTVYNQALNDCNQGQNNWVKKVKRILSEYGFSHVFDNQGNTNYSIFSNVFKQRVIDCFQQGWSGSVNESPVLIIYKQSDRLFSTRMVWIS